MSIRTNCARAVDWEGECGHFARTSNLSAERAVASAMHRRDRAGRMPALPGVFQTYRRAAWVTALSAFALLATSTGCKLMAAGAVLFGNDPTRDVPAEWPYLTEKSVAVAVWAEMDTLFEYPYVQLEVARHIEDALKPNVKSIRFVPAQTVVQYQQREPNWDRRNPGEIGAKLDAERVLFIELTQYRTREPDSPHLFRGRISANVKVFDATAPDSAAQYRTVVDTTYPSETTGEYGTDDVSIRKLTMEAFARDVANKFHDRKEKL